MADDQLDLKAIDKTGVVYLSRIPTHMSVKQLREFFCQFGEVGKVFLQPNEGAPVSKRGRLFSEGWVEFTNKKVARNVAASLNNTAIDAKKKQPWYGELWNIKYLPKFKWTHLSERLSVERATFKDRLRTEISAVKREVDFHRRNAEHSRAQTEIAARKRRRGESESTGTEAGSQPLSDNPPRKAARLKEGRGAMQGRQEALRKICDGPKPKSAANNKAFLSRLFVGGGQPG